MSKSLVLVVDQDGNRVKEISKVLQNYDLFVVSNGEEALNTYEKNYMKIRVVLLQMDLPDMSGIDLLRQLKQICILPEVIIFSKSQDVQIAINAMKEGAFDYLLIPLIPEKLVYSVEQAISSLDYAKKLQTLSQSSRSFDQALLGLDKVVCQSKFIEKSVRSEDIMSVVKSLDSDMPYDSEGFQLQFVKSLDEKLSGLPTSNVLVVEDEEDFADMMKEFLEGKYQVYTAFSGQKALEMVESLPHLEVILLDVFLPDCSGVELVRKMKTLKPDVEIIVVTAFDLIDRAVIALRDGASDYLNKPILKEDLLQTVRKALERKYIRKILPEFRRRFMENQLSDKEKFKMLDELAQGRKKESKSVLMEDVYYFFPDLKQASIPESVALPSGIFQHGVEAFIRDLKSKLKGFNPGVLSAD